MRASLQNSLLRLSGSTVAVSPGNGYPEPGQASVLLLFGEGTKLQAEFWRLIEHGRASFSSFDHQQKYGLPVVIDAIQEHESGWLTSGSKKLFLMRKQEIFSFGLHMTPSYRF